MFLIKTTTPVNATGKVAEIYSRFPTGMPLPPVLTVLSASEPLLDFQASLIGFWMQHEIFTPPFLAAIRYLTAGVCESGGCTTFNGGMLREMGVTDEAISAMESNPLDAPFEPRENELLDFVITAMKTPEAIDAGRIEKLTALGWTEQNIFEATHHAAGMLGPAAVVKAFTRK